MGRTLIISPWNYPLQLLLSPLVGAMAAGNTAVLKPSELAPATSQAVREMIAESFPPDYIAVLEGDAAITTSLLQHSWGHIFFTGGTRVGRIIMKQAAETLSPITLELGGKSPCVIDETADLETAARRIVWGKFLNAGQTCVAPDYLLVQSKVYDALIAALKAEIARNFPSNESYKTDYCRIVNENQFNRLTSLIKADADQIVHGGGSDRTLLHIEPTLVAPATMASASMQEEIFGPILPILKFDRVADAIEMIEQRPNPLAFYIFSKDTATIHRFADAVAFGGGCINHTLIHLGVPDLPFGGVGSSGMGGYHGRNSFLLFSHKKSILHKSTWPDPALLYRPYLGKLNLIRKFIK